MLKSNSTIFIVNPSAGNGRGLRFYEKYLKNKIKGKVKAFLTEFPGHAIEIAKEHAQSFNNLIIVGGDGTVNEVFNGLKESIKLKIGIIPIGTGNDFATNIGYKRKNIEILIKKFLTENPNTIPFQMYNAEYTENKNLGKVLNRRFVNAIGIGFDALVANIVNKKNKKGGILAYLNGVFEGLRSLQYVQIEESSVINTIPEKFLITLGNTKTSGGGFYLSPHANFNQKELAITIIEKIGKLKILRSLPLALINLIYKVREVSLLTAEEIYIKFKKPTVFHCDGEVISEDLRTIKVKPIEHNFRLIV